MSSFCFASFSCDHLKIIWDNTVICLNLLLLNIAGTASIHMMNQEQPNRNPQDSQSWFNTAVSTLLDVIPASPALAAESNVLNRTLQRISSFRSEHAPNEQPSAPVIQVSRRGAGLISVSLLVLLAAILWTFATGTGYAIKFCKDVWKSSSTWHNFSRVILVADPHCNLNN